MAINAADYEAAIVIGFYKIQKRKLDKKTGVSPAVQNKLIKEKDVLETGLKIAQQCIKKFPELKNAQATQTGSATAGTTKFWQSFGAKDKTPKTDILVGTKRFSLKIGPAQLMSGSKAEAQATFAAAIKSTNMEKDPKVKSLYEMIGNFAGSNIAQDKVAKVLKSGEDKLLSEFDELHKKAKSELREVINSNEDFAREFAREAMSGIQKFGADSEACAEFMLVSSKDGNKVSIHSVYDDAYVTKIAKKMRMDCSFKTGSVRRKGEKTGEYRYFSTVRSGVNALSEWLDTDLALVEFKVFSKALSGFKSWAGSVWKKAISYAKSSFENTLKFFELDPQIKINNKINFD